jgi:predicted RNA binding protein YcfA (HicA-like mRNA interferase family)
MIDIDNEVKQLLLRKRNIRFREMEKLLLDLGFVTRQQKRGGSHYVFSHRNIDSLIVLVSHGRNDILPEYQVRKAIQSIQKLKEHLEK